MVAGKPREPANRDRLRELMRGVMVRNTRALAALRMPRRQASTLRALPDPAEAACYDELSALVRELRGWRGRGQSVGRGAASPSPCSILLTAGSARRRRPAAGAIARIAGRFPGEPRWTALHGPHACPRRRRRREAALLGGRWRRTQPRKNWYSCITATA